jgi:hypothetical protein
MAADRRPVRRRGTIFDPFGYAHARQLERTLPDEYQRSYGKRCRASQRIPPQSRRSASSPTWCVDTRASSYETSKPSETRPRSSLVRCRGKDPDRTSECSRRGRSGVAPGDGSPCEDITNSNGVCLTGRVQPGYLAGSDPARAGSRRRLAGHPLAWRSESTALLSAASEAPATAAWGPRGRSGQARWPP